MPERQVKIKILRFNPEKDQKPHWETYEIPFYEGWSVRNSLEYIRKNIDGGLAYYLSCRIGKCLGCLAIINGKNHLICSTRLKGDVTIEPAKGYKVIKDLVVDWNQRIK